MGSHLRGVWLSGVAFVCFVAFAVVSVHKCNSHPGENTGRRFF